MRVRFLRPEERAFTLTVFGAAVPVDDVLITDHIGPGNEPFTRVCDSRDGSAPFLCPLPRVFFAVSLGSRGFDNGLDPAVRAGFARELTRVGEGVPAVRIHHFHNPGVRASYEPGMPWGFYTLEQRLVLVEDWVRGGMQGNDPRLSTIRTHTRRSPHFTGTHAAVASSSAAAAAAGA